MSELPVAAGPPCDICGDEFAALSLMNYADYAQIKAGINCAPGFLRSIADSMDGRQTAEMPAPPEPDPPSNSGSVAGVPDSTSAASGSDDDGQGSARDHWASTTNVRRSTHGHRTPRGATGKPREAEPE